MKKSTRTALPALAPLQLCNGYVTLPCGCGWIASTASLTPQQDASFTAAQAPACVPAFALRRIQEYQEDHREYAHGARFFT